MSSYTDSLMTATKVVRRYFEGIISCILLSTCLVGCVSMRSYREVKASLLHQGMEIEQYKAMVDSIKQYYGSFDKKLTGKDQEIAKLNQRIKMLEEEYNLLLDEYSKEVGD